VFDHVLFDADDFDRSRAFYEMALAPLGMEVVSEPARRWSASVPTAGRPSG
jgi:catechol 2,3-dioxygenase-like lactoylglutathione lyase family enzyme